MNIEEFEAAVEQRGYRYYEDDFTGRYSYFKRSNSPVYCNCNEKPVKFEIRYYPKIGNNIKYEQCEIRIIAETNVGDWVDLAFYSINVQDLLDDLTDFEYRLQRAWESVN